MHSLFSSIYMWVTAGSNIFLNHFWTETFNYSSSFLIIHQCLSSSASTSTSCFSMHWSNKSAIDLGSTGPSDHIGSEFLYQFSPILDVRPVVLVLHTTINPQNHFVKASEDTKHFTYRPPLTLEVQTRSQIHSSTFIWCAIWVKW